jgi:[calcium/calmodulin-dependent protein kinase] kinase
MEAIKEFSKSRLSYHALQERQRHSARSRLRKAARRKAMEGTTQDPEKTATPVSGGPWSVNQATDDDPLGLIRREIAVMKKLEYVLQI